MSRLFSSVSFLKARADGLFGGSFVSKVLMRNDCYITQSVDCSKSLHRKIARTFCSGVAHCWKCSSQTTTRDLFCKQCNVLQMPPKNANYFELLGFESTYEVQLPDMTSKYRRMQNVLHPDRYVNSEEEERTCSAEYSALVNKAYSTLSNPLARGLYMLELEGIYLEEGNIQSDPEFLMEIMEKNEEVDQAKDLSEIVSLDAENKIMIEKLSREVADHFKQGDLKKVTKALIKMKYYARIDSKIKELKQTKFIE